MRFFGSIAFFSGVWLLATTSLALAGNTVSVKPRTAKVFDESREEACRLSRRSEVEAVAKVEDSDLVMVKLKIKGCPAEGYMEKNSLKGSLKDLPTQKIEDEETVEEQTNEAETTESPEASEDCVNCTTSSAPKDKSVDTVAEVIQGIEAAEKKKPETRSFKDILSHWTKNKDKRKLVQIPIIGNAGNIGPCGTHHYNPSSPVGIDAYVSPFAGCMLTAMMQKWKTDYCPKRSGCTLQWGDASHGTKVRFAPHRTHRDGTCVDIRPIRKGGFSDTPLTYSSGNYDRATTLKLVNLAKSMGSSLVIFNDPKIKLKRAKGHHNHLHICFTPNKVANQVCDNLKVDPLTCGELP